MVCGVAKKVGSNVMIAPVVPLALVMAARREPVPLSWLLVTTKEAGFTVPETLTFCVVAPVLAQVMLPLMLPALAPALMRD